MDPSPHWLHHPWICVFNLLRVPIIPILQGHAVYYMMAYTHPSPFLPHTCLPPPPPPPSLSSHLGDASVERVCLDSRSGRFQWQRQKRVSHYDGRVHPLSRPLRARNSVLLVSACLPRLQVYMYISYSTLLKKFALVAVSQQVKLNTLVLHNMCNAIPHKMSVDILWFQ